MSAHLMSILLRIARFSGVLGGASLKDTMSGSASSPLPLDVAAAAAAMALGPGCTRPVSPPPADNEVASSSCRGETR